MSFNRTYFVPPPFIYKLESYQDLNKDKTYREGVTNRFIDIMIKESKFKNYKKLLDSDDGFEIVYTLLKLYVKKSKENWYDLFDQKKLIINYVYYKIKEYL